MRHADLQALWVPKLLFFPYITLTGRKVIAQRFWMSTVVSVMAVRNAQLPVKCMGSPHVLFRSPGRNFPCPLPLHEVPPWELSAATNLFFCITLHGKKHS